MDFHATKKVIDFMILMDKQGSINKDTQRMFFTPQYYIMVSYLKNFGLIEQNGTDVTKKIWCLTGKGKKLVSCFKQIREVME